MRCVVAVERVEWVVMNSQLSHVIMKKEVIMNNSVSMLG